MSQENVEIIRKAIEDSGRDGFFDFATVHPDVEWHALTESVAAGDHRGHDGLRAFLADYSQDWESIRLEVDRLIDAGEDKVVAFVRLKARGKRSGASVERPLAYLCTFRDGLIASVHTYETRAEALAAAGLEE